jgi:hypothetical protein
MARSSSGGLSGQILVPAADRRDLSGLWRQALGLEEATEIPSGTGMPVYLHARGVRSGVTVRIAATVFDDEEDGR